MAEVSLITITDVQTYRKIDPKFNQVRFDPFVRDIQRKNLRGLLGDALYYAFMNDARTIGIYADLLNGKVYEYQGNQIEYYGLKPYLCFLWLAIAAREGDLFLTNYGSVQFVNNPQQSFETAKEKEKIAASYLETAQGYENDIIKFLNENSSDFPLWEGDAEKSTINFITFKI